MAQAFFLSDMGLNKLKRLVNDKQRKRLQEYVCENCSGKMSISSVWTCMSCDRMQNTSQGIFDPLVFFRVIGQMFFMPRTPLKGCSDKYCDNPRLGAVICPHCHVDLVFDKAAYLADPKAVARVPRSVGSEEMLAHMAMIATAVNAPTEEEAHQKELERLRREEEIKAARERANPTKPNSDDGEADDLKDVFKGRGFGN